MRRYVSLQALLALGVMSPHPTSAVPALIECLKSRVYRSEYLSLLVGILIHADRQRAIEALIQVLRENEDSSLRARIASVLGNVGPGSWSAAVPLSNMVAAQSHEPTVNTHRVRLDWLRGPEAATVIAALHNALQDTASAVRISAARALWQLDRQAEPLIPVLCDELKAGNADACSLLREMGPLAKAAAPALIAVVEAKDSRLLGEEAIWTLGLIGPEARMAVPALVAAARQTPNEGNNRRAIYFALARISPEAALPILTKSLKDHERGARIDAAEAIGGLPGAAKLAVPALVAALKDADPGVRNAVSGVLGRFGVPAEVVVPALIVALKDPDSDLRSGAAYALGRVPLWATSGGFGGGSGVGGSTKGTWIKSAVPALTAALNDEHPLVRLNAAEALLHIDEQVPKVLTALLELLKEKEVRRAAIDVLKRMRSQAKAAVPALTRLLDDEDRGVRQGAAEALKQINPIVGPRAGFPGGASQNVPIPSLRYARP